MQTSAEALPPGERRHQIDNLRRGLVEQAGLYPCGYFNSGAHADLRKWGS